MDNRRASRASSSPPLVPFSRSSFVDTVGYTYVCSIAITVEIFYPRSSILVVEIKNTLFLLYIPNHKNSL